MTPIESEVARTARALSEELQADLERAAQSTQSSSPPRMTPDQVDRYTGTLTRIPELAAGVTTRVRKRCGR